MELVDIGLYIAYLLIIIAIATALIFPLIYIIKHPKEARDVVIGLAGFAILFVISYILASDEVLARYANYGVGQTESKLISTGLIAFYILMFAVIVTTLYAEISKLFK